MKFLSITISVPMQHSTQTLSKEMKLHYLFINASSLVHTTDSSPCPSSISNNQWHLSLPSKFNFDLWCLQNSGQSLQISGKLTATLVKTQSRRTRWKPSPKQIRELTALYEGGMHTPSADQRELITTELRKYGRIEGKNVFYWFRNHKARERQKQKRSALLALSANTTDMVSPSPSFNNMEMEKECSMAGNKKRCRSWNAASLDEDEKERCDGTLELFPLRPERKDTI